MYRAPHGVRATDEKGQAMHDQIVTTGLPGLDTILNGLRLGDNVVWRVDDLDDYRAFVGPFLAAALADGRRVVYIRFGRHAPLVEPGGAVTVHDLDAYRGFESFTVRLHTIVAEEGPGVFYLFDCLSDLLDAWATDAMIGNFFLVTCPYLYELDTVAYFALMQPSHSVSTVARIRATTQLLIDLHRCDGELFLHPLKVDGRSSHTMFLPHRRSGDEFVPLTSSVDATALFARLRTIERSHAAPRLDYWDLLFMRAAELARDPASEEELDAMVGQLCRVLIGRDDRMLALARDHFELADLLEIKLRQLGTGFIGGKAVGMLLARKILQNDKGRDWSQVMEAHDSWYIGSDVFYSYIVNNGWWRLFLEQKTEAGYFSAAAALRENLLRGDFPPEIQDEFQGMLEYFGQYPVIVRSSSLQEDGFGNAFAGKYDSVFLVSQGPPEQRYRQFVDGIRAVYASTMSEEALAYRRARGLDRKEEQMALLVQRVSGAYHDQFFFPQLAGVGVSYNTFVWNQRLDPHAGMIRLVFGLGTRAVDRVDGDYPRIVSLDHPLLVPHAGLADASRFSQHNVDLLNVSQNAWRTVRLEALTAQLADVPWHMFGVPDRAAAARQAAAGRRPGVRWILTFDDLLGRTGFPALMRQMLATLERAYRYPVDVEFTAEVSSEGAIRVNLVQCRPLQTKGLQGRRVEIPAQVPASDTLFRSAGNFMGGSIVQPLRRVITVDPEGYAALPQASKYEVGRLVGRLNRLIPDRDSLPTALLGPGRWGTTTPGLGVPVRFAEIRRVAVLGELSFSAGGLMPELSFGSHFFQDLVESGIFYLALFRERDDCFLNLSTLDEEPNRLVDLIPDAAGLSDVVRVVDFPAGGLLLQADILSQQVLCHRVGADRR
ncbi:MAG: PEP/pyruvate-binding domain-containing protein [Candidatus Nanopelagicales bacterium]